MLSERLRRHGIGVSVVAPVASLDRQGGEGSGRIFSSTVIREALSAGGVASAADWLGRPFEIEGRVRQGDRRGRSIGFPTANIALGDLIRPALGVYAIRATADGGVWHDGVANIGIRPTFGGTAPRLEAHLFDFAGDLYGRCLRVGLHAMLRAERRFAGLDELKAQIARDADQARDSLARLPRGPR